MTLDEQFNLAFQHHQAGQLTHAEAGYNQVLAQQPNHARALHLLGVIAHQTAHHAAAVSLIERAIAIDANISEFHCNHGLALAATGQLIQAVQAFERCLSMDPRSYQALYNMGNALRDLGRRDEAIAAHKKGIDLRPRDPSCLNGLGGLLRQAGQTQDAIVLYRRAIAANPNGYEAHHNLANALLESGQKQEAIASFRRALEIQPRSFQTYQALILALMTKETLDQAIKAVRAAAAIWPDSAIAYDQLGVLLMVDQRLDEAEDAFRQAITADPNFFLAHNNLAHIFQANGYVDQAVAAYDKALAIAANGITIASNRLFALQFKPDLEPHALRQELAHWDQTYAAPLRPALRPHEINRDPDRRLRIGYVSPDFRGHVVGWNLLPLLSHHDHERFEIICYSGVEKPDDMTAKLRAAADGWRSLLGLADEQAAGLIRDDQIDILVDLSLHSAGNRLLVFARKPAPIQISYLGYAGSTGLQTIDYRFSDPYLDPPNADLSAYSEQTLRLPNTYWCYQPGGPTPEINAAPAIGNGFVTFGCLSNFARVSPAALELWATLLNRLPHSRLVIQVPSLRARRPVQDFFANHNIGPDRLEFTDRRPWNQYIQTYQRIDIALDPFPYGGGITTCDSLWMGVPVITLAGSTAVRRGACSVLSNIGLPELVAATPADYLSLAMEWERSILLRPSLRQRMLDSPLMNAPQFARDVENAYREICQR